MPERILQDRLFKHPKIKVIGDTAVEEIHGDQNPSKVTHIRLKNVKSGEITDLPADGVFVAIGHAPATELVAGQLKLKPSGYVEIAPHSTSHFGTRRVRGRRCRGRDVSSGSHGRRPWLHGGTRSRTVYPCSSH